MFLKSIRLNNVKCFSDIALSFEGENSEIRKWTLLLAENGTGKSTLLKSIALVTAGRDAITDLLEYPQTGFGIKHNTVKSLPFWSTKKEKNERLIYELNLKIFGQMSS